MPKGCLKNSIHLLIIFIHPKFICLVTIAEKAFPFRKVICQSELKLPLWNLFSTKFISLSLWRCHMIKNIRI